MSTKSLFNPLHLGAIEIPNRIIMAPLTRMRAGANNVPTKLNAEYYAQRASAGLIISEGTAISAYAHGYPVAPGIYTEEQIAGWRFVTDAVHKRGGQIVMQIGHNGRNSHSSLRPDGSRPVAPSAIPPTIPALTSGFQQVKAEVPRALDTGEIAAIVTEFRQAAVNAIEAGFDGVELQGANGHLIEESLRTVRTNEQIVLAGRRRIGHGFCWTSFVNSVERLVPIDWGSAYRPSGSMEASATASPESYSITRSKSSVSAISPTCI
jgi:N-ethylmaleimide reductase